MEGNAHAAEQTRESKAIQRDYYVPAASATQGTCKALSGVRNATLLILERFDRQLGAAVIYAFSVEWHWKV